MRRYGCKPGYYRSGRSCRRIRIPMLGSKGVPSVENREGCHAVDGKWLDSHGGVCIMNEYHDEAMCGGVTAPIKGVIVRWDWIDFYEANKSSDPFKKGDPDDIGFCSANVHAVAVVPSRDGKYSFVEADADMIFDMIVEEYYHIEDCEDLKKLTKDLALSLAKMIKTGDVKGADLFYMTPEGRRTTHRARDAIATDDIEAPYILESYRKMPKPKPFSFKRRT